MLIKNVILDQIVAGDVDTLFRRQKRPTVKGVTYFVASASNPAFKEEIWVGRGIGKIVGRR